MKPKFIVLLAQFCMLGAAYASDCIGDDCIIAPSARAEIQKPAPLPENCTTCGAFEIVPAQSVNVVSIKPVMPDERPPLWDGKHGATKNRAMDKTVDWRDGVPIWDDSVSHYRDKNFYDYFLDPTLDVYFTEQVDTIRSDINSMDATLAQVEELLTPMRPTSDLWSKKRYEPQDMTHIVHQVFEPVDNIKIIEMDDGCPFETDTECAIWRRKPMVRETVSPRSPKIRDAKMCEFIAAATENHNIDASAPAAAPLLERYKMLMQSARACCADGMAHELKRAGATDGLVYKFMSDDANFYGLGSRCLMMNDAEFDARFPNTATAAVAADVRNGCLCRGRQWFTAMLAPFQEAWREIPGFEDTKFNYTYIDGLGRETTVSINRDVRNVLNQLALCP